MDQEVIQMNYKMNKIKKQILKIACAASQSPRRAGVLGTESLTQVVDLKHQNGGKLKENQIYHMMLSEKAKL